MFHTAICKWITYKNLLHSTGNCTQYSVMAYKGKEYLKNKVDIHIYTHKYIWIEVTQSCQTLCDPIDCSLPGSSVHGIFQARILDWVAIFFSRGSSWPRDLAQISLIIAGRLSTAWATRGSYMCVCVCVRVCVLPILIHLLYTWS